MLWTSQIIRDSSDSNTRLYDLVLAGESQCALYIENMELSGTS